MQRPSRSFELIVASLLARRLGSGRPAGDADDTTSHLLRRARLVHVFNLCRHQQLSNPLLVNLIKLLDDLTGLSGGARIERLKHLLEGSCLIHRLYVALEQVEHDAQVELKKFHTGG